MAKTRTADAEQELSTFSYSVSHDLSASFRQISAFSRLLLIDLGDGLTDRQRRHADYVHAATEKCGAMMEQLLIFSRVQQKTLSLVERDATPPLQMAIFRLSDEIRASQAKISYEPVGDARADMDMLAQALELLLDNAIKFRRPDVPPHITVRPAHDAAWWRLLITDNGLGVEPDFREKAFEMFRRLNGENEYPGVGAGLTISRRIARKHGGEVRFVDCDEGACVELTLPRAAAAP